MPIIPEKWETNRVIYKIAPLTFLNKFSGMAQWGGTCFPWVREIEVVSEGAKMTWVHRAEYLRGENWTKKTGDLTEGSLVFSWVWVTYTCEETHMIDCFQMSGWRL